MCGDHETIDEIAGILVGVKVCSALAFVLVVVALFGGVIMQVVLGSIVGSPFEPDRRVGYTLVVIVFGLGVALIVIANRVARRLMDR